jgi:YVTN family beta-propeller protein
MGASISMSSLAWLYNAAAITTLDRLEFENNIARQNIPHFDVALESPTDVDIDNDFNRVYVANSNSDTVSVIDSETLKLVKVIAVGEGPNSIAVDSLNGLVFVASGNGTVSVIDSETLDVTNVDVGGSPRSIAVASSDKTYVADIDTVSVIDSEYVLNVTNTIHFPSFASISMAVRSDNVYVYNPDNGTVSVIGPIRYGPYGLDELIGVKKNFAVGIEPGEMAHMAINWRYDTAYIASDNGIVSVINASSNPRYINNIANFTVQDIYQIANVDTIAVEGRRNIAYLAYSGARSNFVSVINGTDLRNINNIANFTVGQGPYSIAIDDRYPIVYVANSGSDTVSVIDGETLDVTNVDVGREPGSIAVDEENNMAYVVNQGSNTLSVISGTRKQVQAGVSFDVNPPYGGHIECNDITAPTNQYFYIDFRTQCTALANQGFQFNSWIENSGSNSSRTISASQGDWFTRVLDWVSGKPSPVTLNVTKFGNFTANFETLPPAIPPEYLATLFTVVVTAFVGSWLAPGFIGWRRAKKQGNKLDNYHQRLKHLYDDGKLDKNDIDDLDKLRNDITDEYARGKINKEQFDKLTDDISISYQEIFKKEIDSFNRMSEKDKDTGLSEVKDNIEDAYAKRKIGEQHYNLLSKKIESFVTTHKNQTSDDKLEHANKTHVMKRSPL